MYDIIVLGEHNTNWGSIKHRFPMAKRALTFEEARKKALTHLFWVVWDDVVVFEDFNFDYHVSVYDEQYVHVFQNDNKNNGICIFSKQHEVTQESIKYRHFQSQKEVNVVASVPRMYDIIVLGENNANWELIKTRFPTAKQATTFEEARNISSYRLFWVVWDDVVVFEDFNFDYHVSVYDEQYVHVFQNDKYYDGICIFSKQHYINKRSLNYRFFPLTKEININASVPIKYDIVFISYNEVNAEHNWKLLQSKYPTAKRVSNVTGIHNAHIHAAQIATTHMFWVVDGDAIVVDEFNFDYQVPRRDCDLVHVWRSINPINKLEYGYGGVKLLPRALTLALDKTSTDMTTSISSKFKVVEETSNITQFNTDPFSTWKSAFRECVKLSSKSITGQLLSLIHI